MANSELEKTRKALVKAMKYVKDAYAEWPCCTDPFGPSRFTDGPHAPRCRIARLMKPLEVKANA